MPASKSGVTSSDHGRRSSSKEADADENPTNTLWVGNLSPSTVDADVMEVFSKHGALDCVTMHGSRSYSFVLFRSVDEARAAMDALQGTVIRGNAVRIQFSRPAKAARQLWIGGISSSISKEQLEDEFLIFGKIEDYRFFRDRNSALIDYYKLEDAITAHKSMNGKRLGGEQLRVDFQRSQPLRRDWPDHDSRNVHLTSRGLGPLERSLPPDGMKGFHDSSYYASKRHMPHGGRREGYPSNVLWVGYPPSVQIDEQMLHNAMILFGEIERIKCFPSRHYCFVEFRSTDEARRAKEGLQGRLFNDPRIQILFSSSEVAPIKDNPPQFPGLRGPRPEMFSSEGPFGSLESYGPGHPLAPNNFPGPLHPNNMPGPDLLMRPVGRQGIDPRLVGAEYHDFGDVLHDLPDPKADKSLRAHWQRRSPSQLGILPSPQNLRPPFQSMPGAWDTFDMRETKRLRMDRFSPDDVFFNAKSVDSETTDYSRFSHPDIGSSARRHFSPVVPGTSELRGSPDNGHCWRGIIAKGGSHVCHARCVPIGKGINSPLPEVVNCSARTGLDMLTKHYAEAIGFDIVFFLPDSEEDFASYTEFLRYLGLKSRAGVAKLDDGTTLFLVPPSDFLTEVLNITGPERLYGVVLKFPQQSTTAAAQQPQLPIPPTPSQYIGRQDVSSSHKGYIVASQNEEQAFKVDYNRSFHEEPLPPAETVKPLSTYVDEAHAEQASSLDYANNGNAATKMEVSLTPELIATLSSLIPGNIQSAASGAVQTPPSSTVRSASASTSMMHDRTMPIQGWRQENQATISGISLEQASNAPQHLGQYYPSQAHNISHFPESANISSAQGHSAQPFISSAQIQNSTLNLAQTLTTTTRTVNTPVMLPQGGQFPATQINQQYQFDSSFASQNAYGMLQTPNSSSVFNPAIQQQPNPIPSSGNDQIGSFSYPQNAISLPTDKVNMEFPSQGAQLQSSLSSSAQGNLEGDANKNQRYQSTLQFAASLLLQIQQQQQSSAKSVQGSGNQQ
ncbi:flowering time control protein FPA [Typha latifolia]|uniref:flowering time control protein FPA n=1 Tax=Typha latifolia TaxID=4733 RepID=UPI003C2AC3D1